MRSIFESAKTILEQSSPNQDQLAALTKVMLSMGASYGEINAVRSKLGSDIMGGLLLNIVSVIAGNTTLFNSFVKSYKGISEDTELVEDSELNEDKLQNDIKSLKKIGWKLDKVIPFMVTKSDEYGVKITSDLVTMYYTDGGAKKAPKTPAVKVYKPKKVSWPKDPPKNKIDDAGHAEAYLGQAVDSEESPDIYGMEAYQLLITAGYTERAAMAVMKNMGWDGDVKKAQTRTSKFAKKTASKFHK